MANLATETVLDVHHWTDTLFSFTTTRRPAFRFRNGHFTMIGLPDDQGRPLLRAYSIVSANYEEQLEFFSIKVADGPLTSRLQKIKAGDPILVSSKPTGSLLQEQLLPGRHLYLLSTGTGLAPFMSLIKDPDIYQRFDKIILVHGCRYAEELAYANTITEQLPGNEYLGELIREQLIYYPTVTREPYRHNGRITDLLASGQLNRELDLPPPHAEHDRFMLCGSPAMLKDCSALLNGLGFKETRNGAIGQYVIERAFVEH